MVLHTQDTTKTITDTLGSESSQRAQAIHDVTSMFQNSNITAKKKTNIQQRNEVTVSLYQKW